MRLRGCVVVEVRRRWALCCRDSAGEVGVRIHLQALLHNLVASPEPAYNADCAKVQNAHVKRVRAARERLKSVGRSPGPVDGMHQFWSHV